MSDFTGNNNIPEEKQCRICFDGVEAERELGRLIRPCLCKGSISVRAHTTTGHYFRFNLILRKYVHVKCLQKWRNTSLSTGAFFSCPQCHYKYRFARTRIVGLASNPSIFYFPSQTNGFEANFLI
jgi:E3 ubiquitin-protein ligase DOA10